MTTRNQMSSKNISIPLGLLQELMQASHTLLQNACDSGIVSPTQFESLDYSEYPKDEDGSVWEPDWFEFSKALFSVEAYLEDLTIPSMKKGK